MNRNWYSPCSAVVAVLSVFDSLLVSTTVAPATVLPLGSITVPRSDVAACPAARTLMPTAKHSHIVAAQAVCRATGRRFPLETPQATYEVRRLRIIDITFSYEVGSPSNITR